VGEEALDESEIAGKKENIAQELASQHVMFQI